MSGGDHSLLEALFWQIMRRFEDVAVAQYALHVEPLATPAKCDLVERLAVLAPDSRALDESGLAKPLGRLLAAAVNDSRIATVVVQGLVLEQLGQAIYGNVAANANVSREGREVAATANQASLTVTSQVPDLYAAAVPDPGRRFEVFAEESHNLLLELDGLGDAIDQTFGATFELQFKDIAGEFVARAVPVCTALGMKRREVVSHLAGALMGF